MNIGIFDSGIGGITLLHQALLTLPKENYIFYADVDHVPYGTKTREQVIEYVDEVIRFMVEHDCKAVVIACNTATSVAAALMRAKYSIPIIGIEPAVKPAVEQHSGKRVMVIATPLAVREEKLKNLVARVDSEHMVDLLALPRLVEFAEAGEFGTSAVEDYLREELAPYDLANYSELVLGCTHFNYFKDSYAKIFENHIHMIDGSEGTVNQLKRVLEQNRWLEENEGRVRYFESGREIVSEEGLERIRKLHRRLDEMKRL
ncbi:MAG: glutamate racemase [Lachnospiraceae bacterium]|nr:glutamate racemase [Lachnospiraceae bacterium]